MEIKGNLTTSIEANQCEYQAKGREKKLEIFRINSLVILNFFALIRLLNVKQKFLNLC